jgi:hypothetical protein
MDRPEFPGFGAIFFASLRPLAAGETVLNDRMTRQTLALQQATSAFQVI